MTMTPFERLLMLKIMMLQELLDPINAAEHDRDAQALELGDPIGIARMFDLIDLDPTSPPQPQRPRLWLV